MLGEIIQGTGIWESLTNDFYRRSKTMTTNIKRRVFLKGSMAAGVTSAAVLAGVLTPQAVIAAWNESAFSAKSEKDAISSAMVWKSLPAASV